MTQVDPTAPQASSLLRDPRRVAVLGGAGILVLGVLGILQRTLPEYPLSHVFDLDFEWAPPALFAALLLLGAARSWAHLVDRRAVARSGVFLAALLAFMSLDEWLGLHERLERATGVDWKTLYAPLVLAAGVAGLQVLLRWRASLPSLLLALGGGLWFVAQVLETLEWEGDGDVPVSRYDWYMIPEELLEMTGSLLVWLSALVLLQRVGRRPSA